MGHPSDLTVRLPRLVSTAFLFDEYDAFAFDSYGVLVDGIDPLPGALELTSRLNDAGKPWVVATNDASRLPERRLDSMRRQGFEIELGQIVTSGSLLKGFFESRGIVGERSIATGSGEAVEYVSLGGCEPVVLDRGDVSSRSLILAGILGYDWAEALADVVSLVYRRIDAGDPLHLAVPNPDVLYPNGTGRYAIGPGGLAGLIESAVRQGFGDAVETGFERLGKPYAAMFDEIKRRLPPDANTVFIGDQLRTDIEGANRAGMSSALVGTGIFRWDSVEDFAGTEAARMPDYVVRSLD